MEIKVLGGGCANCRALEAMAREAVANADATHRAQELMDSALVPPPPPPND